MMDQRQSPAVYPANLSNLLAVSYQNDRLSTDRYNTDFTDTNNSCSSPASLDSDQSFGVDLSGKPTLTGKSFTIAAILGLSNEEEVLQGQRRLQHWYSGQEVHRINDGFCRSMVNVPGLRQDSRQELRPQSQLKTNRNHTLTCSSSSGRSKRIRTIFTPEQLERLEAEFERQQYMVGPERLYLAHALQLTEAQVKVWFQNRRIKWRKHHLEVTQQRLAVLQRHRPERDDDI